MRDSIGSHAELVAAIRSRDVEAAERIGRQHLELSRDVTLGRLRRIV
jgi:DNA-binding GntR family transcriptional regulator